MLSSTMGGISISGRNTVLYCGFSLILLLVASAGSASAQTSSPPQDTASVFDEVDECDLLAAHPADPGRVAEGVADGSIVPRLAVRACLAAARRQVREWRFVYQLGRAYAAGGQMGDAQRQFEQAAQAGYAPALSAEADLRLERAQAQRGNGPPMETIRAARQAMRDAAALHEQAHSAGFAPAQQRVQALTFDPAIFAQPILGQILNGNVDAARAASQKAATRAYLYAVTTNLMGQCGPMLAANALAQLAAYRFFGGITEAQENGPEISAQPLLGEVDAQRFIRRHGCDGPVTTLFFEIAMPFYLSAP